MRAVSVRADPSGSVRPSSHGDEFVRFLMGAKRADEGDDRLLWSRDIRYARRLADAIPNGRVFELDAGIVVIGPAIIKERTRLLGGQLTVESTRGAGARIEVTFGAPVHA